MKVVIEYSPWFIVLCLIAGSIYALALYYRENRSDIPAKLRMLLGIFRFTAISIICILLLSPLLRMLTRIYQKPLLIFAQDNSASIRFNKDSLFYKKEYPLEIKKLLESLEDDFEVIPLSFGNAVTQGLKTDYTDAVSDLGQAVQEISDRYSYSGSAAVILASDGLFNKGVNPVYASENWKMPVYTIALGDTVKQVDALIDKVNYNRVVFSGNRFPVEVSVRVNKLPGKELLLEVLKNNEVVERLPLRVNSSNCYRTLNFSLEAGNPGIQKITTRISETKGEITYINNTRHFFVEVIGNQHKVIILYDAPHPDISAIKQVLEKNIMYEVSMERVGEFTKDPRDFDVFVFYQLPSARTNPSQLQKSVADYRIPALYITGSQFNINAFNNLNNGVQLTGSKGGMNESEPVMSEDFSLFSLKPGTMEIIPYLPPLISPFAEYRIQGSANVLFYQEIRGIKTNIPMVVFNDALGRRSVTILGEGLWRWRLQNYLKSSAHTAFDDMMGGIFQYLSVKTDNSRFKVYYEDIYNENAPVLMSAELYNENYQMINDPEVNVVISGKDNQSYPYTFSRSGNSYRLDIGLFPPGEYRFKSVVQSGNKTLTDEGRFIVAAVNVESINTTADHNLLYKMAASHGGKMIYPRDINALAEELKKRDDLKTTFFSQKKFIEMLNLPWILGLLLFLFSVEWFFRKRSGAY